MLSLLLVSDRTRVNHPINDGYGELIAKKLTILNGLLWSHVGYQ